MEANLEPGNNVLFEDLCNLLEQLYKIKQRPEKEKVLTKFIIDFKCKAAIERGDKKHASFYPILRLLVPTYERERGAYNLKQHKLGELLVRVLGLNKTSHDAQKLLNPPLNSTHGDYGNTAYFVLKNRIAQKTCNLTVGDINDILDKIASAEVGNKKPILDDLFSTVLRNLAPEQMKWFLRMILKDMRVGMSPKQILYCYHPDAPEHYEKYGNLAKVCEELEDGSARVPELGVELFYAVSPMLSERLDVTSIGELPANATYQIEEKFDGERFQIHMENKASDTDPSVKRHVYEYFSRKGFAYSSTYGKTYDSGLLTPRLEHDFSSQVTSFVRDDSLHIRIHMENKASDSDPSVKRHVYEYFSRKGFAYSSTYGKTYDSGLLTPRLEHAFSSQITSFVLDGEMMGWHKENQCFGSKGMAFDVKKITEKSKFQPCFVAFDLLYFNGRSLVGPEEKGGMNLSERLKLLDMMFKDVKGVINHSTRKIVEKSSDILNAVNKAIDNQEEGIVVKDIESLYIVNKRNAGWYKIKPEYTNGAIDDLDLVIIGVDAAENKRHGLAKSFLIAVGDAEPGVPPHRWLCVGRVATGLTNEERNSVCTLLQRQWQVASLRPPPPSLVFNKIKPDFWILPEHSIVLQVRATELIISTDFGTPYTLRFPRVKRLREDKHVNDAMTLQEFNKLVEKAGPVIKLSNKRLAEELILGPDAKTIKKRIANLPQVPYELMMRSAGDVEVVSQALKGRKICILSDEENCKKEDIIRIVESHGGKCVVNPGGDTWVNVVGRHTYRARNVITQGEVDIAPVSWLRALPISSEPCAIEPLDLVAMKRETRLNNARKYDVFGDSFMKPATEDSLKRCFEKMCEEDQVYPTAEEMMHLDRELFGETNPFSYLRPCIMHIASGHRSALAFRAQMLGATLCSVDDASITHVVLPSTTEPTRVQEYRKKVKRQVVVVSEEWLEKCFSQEKLVLDSIYAM